MNKAVPATTERGREACVPGIVIRGPDTDDVFDGSIRNVALVSSSRLTVEIMVAKDGGKYSWPR